jgi:hypothetical protein
MEAGGVPPERLASEVRSTRYVSLLERRQIATLCEQGHGVREIARRIGRAASSVSRELQRNVMAPDMPLLTSPPGPQSACRRLSI